EVSLIFAIIHAGDRRYINLGSIRSVDKLYPIGVGIFHEYRIIKIEEIFLFGHAVIFQVPKVETLNIAVGRNGGKQGREEFFRRFSVYGDDFRSNRDRVGRLCSRENVYPSIDDLQGKREVMAGVRSEEHTSELQSRRDLVCRL